MYLYEYCQCCSKELVLNSQKMLIKIEYVLLSTKLQNIPEYHVIISGDPMNLGFNSVY